LIGFAALAAATVLAVRIVSLAPALTEDLFAIGAGQQVVGVDDLSNRPPAARRLPRVGSMRTINSEAIAALDPDLVVGIAYQSPSLRDLSRLGVRTRTVAVDTLADDFAAISALGQATGRVGEAARLLATIHRRLDTARRTTHALNAPRALAFIGTGLAPFYTAGRGSYIDDLFEIAHIRNVAGDLHAAFPALSAETIEAADPDVLIVPRGAVIPNEPPWSRLRAVRLHHIVALDEDDYLRPGPRVADVVDALVRGIAPYRASVGATAKAYTAPPDSRRTAIGIPYTRLSSASSNTAAGASHAKSVRVPSSAMRSANAAATFRSWSTTTADFPPAISRRTSVSVSKV
jgi:ABC-type Fe3+-hydroxamate transport system substrate-binding protein